MWLVGVSVTAVQTEREGGVTRESPDSHSTRAIGNWELPLARMVVKEDVLEDKRHTNYYGLYLVGECQGWK